MRALRKPGKPKLGAHLEWHGAKIRAVIRVPPSLAGQLGTKLRTPLPTDNPRLAEVLKLSAIQDMKATIYRARHGKKDDPLIMQALALRQGIERAKAMPEPEDLHDLQDPYHVTLELAADNIADDVRAEEGDARANLFLGVALGEEHPLSLFVDDWITAGRYAARSEASMRQAVTKLEAWCVKGKDVRPVLEMITPKVAARYVEEVFEKPRISAATANKLLSGLRNYWKWLRKSHRLDPDKHVNPWTEMRIEKEKAHRSEHDTDKRPFTDTEAKTLLDGISIQPIADMMRVSLATGMRLTEVANLRVSHVQDGMVRVRIGKTRAGKRDFPMPSALEALFARRLDDKKPDAYVFDDLPLQKYGKRGRGAPASQTFTRVRRKLGVDDVPPGSYQSRIDFHSCRRWFIRKAGEALANGATGFTPWTIADVVGHDTKADGPLPLTMGLYPGRASPDAMRACLEAVKLPSNGLAAYRKGIRRKGRPRTTRQA